MIRCQNISAGGGPGSAARVVTAAERVTLFSPPLLTSSLGIRFLATMTPACTPAAAGHTVSDYRTHFLLPF